MNYHFFIDEKFIDDFIADAMAVSNDNVFVYTFNQPAKFVKSDEGIYAPHASAQLKSVLKRIKPTDRVFIHWYHKPIDSILARIPRRTKIYLMFWGGDFFEYPPLAGYKAEAIKSLYDTRSYHRYKKYFEIKWKSLLKNLWKELIVLKLPKQLPVAWTSRYFNSVHRQRRRFLKRLSGICHWNPHDIQTLEKQYNLHLKHIPFCYSVGKAPDLSPGKSSDKVVFWLGNSDTITNNHLDALEVLRRFSSEKIKIYCPLNYGHRWYGNIVAGRGRKLFQDKFQPLKDFIPREEYYHMMDEVDVAVMYHNRSQGGGNIFNLLMKGKKVYLKPFSSIYLLLREMGLHVFSTDDLGEKSLQEIARPLTPEQAKHNHHMLREGIYNETLRLQNLSWILNN